MRTKTLLLAAALSAAGLATSMAQSNVYSLNVVGYINVPLVNGANAAGQFNLFANPLDKDGTGVNNTLNEVLGTNNWATGTSVSGFNPATGLYETAAFNQISHTWGANAIAALACQPGNGMFLKNGNAGTAGPTNITLVGNVMQGALVNPIVAGFQLASSMVPQGGLISTDLGLTTAQIGDGSQCYQFDEATQLYSPIRTVSAISHNWNTQPTLGVAEAVFLNSHNATSWDRSFTVQ